MTSDSHLVDAHVHFYGVYDRARFFGGALANFRAAAVAMGLDPAAPGYLMFSEAAGDHYFRQFRDEAGRPGADGWSFRHTQECDSLIAARTGGGEIVLVAGRQIATVEGLEILALGADAEFPDGHGFAWTLKDVLASEALAVVPWGFGKWWFGRGRLLSAALDGFDPGRVFLSDNSGRPRGFLRPALFAHGRALGLRVLPGTDPLPFAHEAGKAGGFGFVLEGALDMERPAEAIRAGARALADQPRAYGRLETWGRFARHQVAMQARKRRRAS